MTEYRNIKGFPGYRVGDDGTVWTSKIRGNIKNRNDGPWRLLTPKPQKTGYHRVCLHDEDGRMWSKYVHRLVLESFVGPCPTGMMCRHFPDKNRGNNQLGNLQWGTHEENTDDRSTHGTNPTGEKHPSSKMTEAMVIVARQRYSNGETLREIALNFRVHLATVQRIVKRKTWSHI